MQIIGLQRKSRLQTMTTKKSSFLKTVIIFTISPGFSGILFLGITVLPEVLQKPDVLSTVIKAITDTILLGFFGGLIFYITPAFILGLIYANLELKKNWKSYLFVAAFSPIFLLIQEIIFEYTLPKSTNIPGTTRSSVHEIIMTIGPMSSFSSIIAAWLSFPKANIEKHESTAKTI